MVRGRQEIRRFFTILLILCKFVFRLFELISPFMDGWISLHVGCMVALLRSLSAAWVNVRATVAVGAVCCFSPRSKAVGPV